MEKLKEGRFYCYISKSQYVLQGTELFDLISNSITSNKSHNITGLFLYNDDNYFQYIEGEKEELNQLVVNINSDRRHYDIIELCSGNLKKRLFDHWSLAATHCLEDDLFDFIKELDFNSAPELVFGKIRVTYPQVHIPKIF